MIKTITGNSVSLKEFLARDHAIRACGLFEQPWQVSLTEAHLQGFHEARKLIANRVMGLNVPPEAKHTLLQVANFILSVGEEPV